MKWSAATKALLKVLAVLALLYCFLLSITLMGDAFRLFGEGFAERLFALASNKFVGLFIGILTTALVQSSSCTTSIVVGLVGGGVLDIGLAVPIIMGANIGTSVTNMLVAHGHITRRDEFRRATESAVVHDIFNLLAVIILFPLEMMFGILENSAKAATDLFGGLGGVTFTSPLKAVIKPVSHFVTGSITTILDAPTGVQAAVILVLALTILFLALFFIVKVLKSLVLARVEGFFSTYIFRNAVLSLFVGLTITALVQSSSVTTSLIVPMAAAGILTLEQIFPYTLGANVGTTVTAILASLATVSAGNMGGVTVAFTHLLFNIFGIALLYPLRFVPIGLARELGHRTAGNRFFPLFFVACVFFYIPGICIYLSKFGLNFLGVLLIATLPVTFVVFRLISKAVQRRAGVK
jgi:sodium-dependent phosphate cotransporter